MTSSLSVTRSLFCEFNFMKSSVLSKVKLPHYSAFRFLRRVRSRKLNEEETKFSELMQLFRSKKAAEIGTNVNACARVRTVTIDKNPDAIPVDHQEIPINESNESPVNAENQYAKLTEKVTPLLRWQYIKQLRKKHIWNGKVLKEFGMKLKCCNINANIDMDGTPCALDLTVPSPSTEAYRNKDEFSIRPGVDGNPKTVGFFLDSPSDNPDTICVPPDEIAIIKDSHKLLAKEFQNYIRTSPLPPCLNFSEGGYWRNVIARSNAAGDLMGIVIVHPMNLTEEELNVEKNKLKEYFSHESRKELNLKSFYFQACSHTRCTHAQAPFQLLFGEPYIFEEINGFKYRISPETFVQVNTAAAEKLYKVIFNTCKASKITTVLDICCGAGPVSLQFAPHVKKCIGIDISEESINDAKENARINGITNAEFHAGRCEFALENILNELYAEELIAIVNPARSALGNAAMNILRECRYLKKVLFVSCKPEAAIHNYIQLCKPANPMTRLGKSFVPLRAVPVDLFPHTNHCELLVLFQRL